VGGVTDLLERDSELGAIDEAIEDVRHGAGRAVVIEGLAGAGKTRLLAAARDRAGAAGMLVLSARGSDLEREFSYGIVRQLFEPVLIRLGKAERRDIFAGPANACRAVSGRAADGTPTIGVG
jgi:predicted ATPase